MPSREPLTSVALPVSRQTVSQFNTYPLINAFLLAVCAALIFYYVLSANGLTAANYRISSLREDIIRATDRQTELSTQAARLEDTDAIRDFAAAHQMVLSKDTPYLFEKGNVALVR